MITQTCALNVITNTSSW